MNKISKNNIEATNWIDSVADAKGKADTPEVGLPGAVNVAKKVTANTINSECERIEKIASSKKEHVFCINGTWDAETKSYLKEYAIACGLDKDKIVEVSKKQIVASASRKKEADKIAKEAMTKTASTKENALQNEIEGILGDPFKINEKLEDDRNIHEEWEKVSTAKTLSDKPSTSGINALRGGEDYNANFVHQSGLNQNSILDPEKLDRLAESDLVDNGEKIRQEKAKILEERQAEQQKVRDDLVSEAEQELSIMTIGNVFPTESLNAQSGIQGEMGGKLLDVDSVPEKTEGEMIKEMNVENKAKIQRPKEEDRSWEKIDTNVRTISDDFGEELSKILGK